MEYFSLVIELIFLGIGLYVYLFSRGLILPKEEEARQKAEAFRKSNATWMRILSLLLMAMMAFNIYLHIKQWNQI